MKFIFSSILILSSSVTFANSIRGTITVEKSISADVKGGTLFVFAKNIGSKAGDGQMPVAVQRIANPKFPVKFELSAENTMIKDTPFEGPFSIYARYSISGDATDKSGPQGSTPENAKIKVGDKSVKIELKKK